LIPCTSSHILVVSILYSLDVSIISDLFYNDAPRAPGNPTGSRHDGTEVTGEQKAFVVFLFVLMRRHSVFFISIKIPPGRESGKEEHILLQTDSHQI